MKENEANSLELMIGHEEAIRKLYERFAERFADQRALWGELAEEELRHADCLRELWASEPIRKWFQNSAELKRVAIQGSIDYVEAQQERTERGEVDLLEALSIAKDLEEALIEKQFVRLNIAGPDEVKKVVRELVADTHRHRKRIAESLDFYKNSPR